MKKNPKGFAKITVFELELNEDLLYRPGDITLFIWILNKKATPFFRPWMETDHAWQHPNKLCKLSWSLSKSDSEERLVIRLAMWQVNNQRPRFALLLSQIAGWVQHIGNHCVALIPSVILTSSIVCSNGWMWVITMLSVLVTILIIGN